MSINGVGDSIITAPADVSNHGLRFWAQALTFDPTLGGGGFYLSNVITEAVAERWFR